MKKKLWIILFALIIMAMPTMNAFATHPAIIEPVPVGTTGTFDAGEAGDELEGSTETNTNTSRSPSPFSIATTTIDGFKKAIQDLVYTTGTTPIRVKLPDGTIQVEYNRTIGQWIQGNRLIQVDQWEVDFQRLLQFIGNCGNVIKNNGDGRTPKYTSKDAPLGPIGERTLNIVKTKLPTLGLPGIGLFDWIDWDEFMSLYPSLPEMTLEEFLRRYSSELNVPNPPEWVTTIVKTIRTDIVPGGFEDRESTWGRYEWLERTFLSRGARDHVRTLYITEYTVDKEEEQKIVKKTGSGNYEWQILNLTTGDSLVQDGPRAISVTFNSAGEYIIKSAEYMDVTRADVATCSRDEIWVSKETGAVLWRKVKEGITYESNTNYSSEKVDTNQFYLTVTEEMIGRKVLITTSTDGIVMQPTGFESERIQ